MREALSVGFDDVRAAAERLKRVAHRTPVLTSRTLNEMVGAEVFLKCENLQRMGAFKFRGAYNCLTQFDDAQRAGGAVAYSSGNHAQGVALAAQLLGIRATIVMPRDAPTSKLAATRGYGAEVVLYDRAGEDRAEIAQGLCDERHATLVPPYDDRRIIAGAATATLELFEDVPDLEMLVAPVGGGGLFGGACIVASQMNARVELWGVEPEAGDDVRQSFERGERVQIALPDTIADGLQTQSPGALTFPIIRSHASGIATIGDRGLRDAMRFLFERMKLVVEPSGAAAFAAVMFQRVAVRGKRVGLILSGGNVDAERFARLLLGG